MRKKAVREVLAALFSVSFLIFVFFTALKLGIFNLKFIDREMEKLNTAERISMEDEDLHELFVETLKYLSLDREDLVIRTVVDGQEREAFNEREKLHMEDVRGLFEQGFRLRTIAAVLAVLSLAAMLALFGWRRTLLSCARAFVIIGLGLTVIVAVCAGLLASDFTRYFTVFHEIFFDNDLWLLDPDTSLMINMVPETFFHDMAMRLVRFIAIPFGLLLLLGAGTWRYLRKKTVER